MGNIQLDRGVNRRLLRRASAGIPRKVDGVLHGLITFGLSTLIVFYLPGTAVGSIIGGAFKLAGGVASTAV